MKFVDFTNIEFSDKNFTHPASLLLSLISDILNSVERTSV